MNKNKKKVLIVLALLLAAAMAVGITIAWFTDTETVTNKATMGAVDVELNENVEDPTPDPNSDDESFSDVDTNDEGDEDDPTNPKYTVPDPEDDTRTTPLIPGTPTDDGAEYPESFPGTSYVKQPTVDNLEEPSLVRLVITRAWVDENGDAVANTDPTKIILHKVNADDWTWTAGSTAGEDIVYYGDILAKKGEDGDSTTAPFDYFTVSSAIDNAYAGLTAKIDIKVEAVQAAGLGVTDAKDVPATVWASVTAASTPAPAPEAPANGGEGGNTAN